MRYSQQAYRQYYTEEQKAAFLKRMARLDAYDVDDPDVLKDIFLGIYANPLQNKKELLAYTGQL
jgi:dihydropteroate synthase